MANLEHLQILAQGVGVWNGWREENNQVSPDFSGADFSDMDLSNANLSSADLHAIKLIRANLAGSNLNASNFIEANLIGADFSGANLSGANLKKAALSYANFENANLDHASLIRANLSETNMKKVTFNFTELMWANFSGANLSGAKLIGADLSLSILVSSNFSGAELTNCRIYGISAWGLNLNDTIQNNLIITPYDQPDISVDNIEVAQFIYLLLDNKKLRDMIDSITSKVVLILGRFSEKQKPVLDAVRVVLREHNYCPVLFDFDKPFSKSFVETVATLAHISRFVIADFTDAKIVLQEVEHIVRDSAVPLVPLLLEGSGREPTTVGDLRLNHKSLLETYRYKDTKNLLESLEKEVIGPAESRAKELLKEQAARLANDYGGNNKH